MDYNGSGGSTNGGGSLGTGSWKFGKGLTGIKITLTDGQRNSEKNPLCSFDVTRAELEDYYNFTDINKWWTSSDSVNSTYLYSYLNIPYSSNSGNYNSLLWFIQSYCAPVTITNDTFIYIEPFASKGNTLYTLHQLLINGPESNDGAAARILANAASTGTSIGVYTAVSGSCTKDSWIGGKRCGVNTYGGNGYGVIEIKASEIQNWDPPKPVPDIQPINMVITKLDTNGNPISGVTFTLTYLANKTTMTATTNSDGVVTFNDLTSAYSDNTANPVYTLTETVPSGYNPESSVLHYEDYGIGNRAPDDTTSTTSVWNIYVVDKSRFLTVQNEKTCISEFNSIDKNDLSERIRLYKTYKSSDNMYLNNLLNLNITDADTACSYKACNQSIDSGCLAITNVTTNQKDFSCYDFMVNNEDIYCFSNFDLQNLFSGSPSRGTYQFGQSKTLFAGQLITNLQNAAQLTLDIYCYSSNDVGDSLNINKKYSDFISKITFKYDDLELGYENKNNSIVLTNKSSNYGGYVYSSNTTSYFTFPKVYSHIVDGKIKYDITNEEKNSGRYRELGYGLASKLDDVMKNNKEIDIKYSVYFGETVTVRDSYSNVGDNDKYTDSNSCSYILKNNIIENPGDPNNPEELNLEFRLIDGTISDSSQSSTINLFPGKLGNGRKVGSNWCKHNITACASNDKFTYDEINMEPVTNGINSYGIKPSDGSAYKAKYTIELDASTIQKIRTYNDSVGYDEYDLTCDENGNCEKSKFLMDTSIWNSDNLEIITDESARRR
ncbi:MAG: hypothetical protein IJY25_05070 [Bacilli bacterium]|nr:hypothetical protein [Bacilli bacterium]